MKKSALCLFLLALAALPVAADELYSNGPVNGTLNAWAISFGGAVEDSFTLSSASSLSSLTFYVWVPAGDTVTSVDWGIDTVPGTYTDAHVASTTQNYLTTNVYGFDSTRRRFLFPEILRRVRTTLTSIIRSWLMEIPFTGISTTAHPVLT